MHPDEADFNNLDPTASYSASFLDSLRHKMDKKWAQIYCTHREIKHYGKKQELIQRVIDHAAGKKVPSARRYGKRHKLASSAPSTPAPGAEPTQTTTEQVTHPTQGPRSIDSTVVPAVFSLDLHESPLGRIQLSQAMKPHPAPSGFGLIPANESLYNAISDDPRRLIAPSVYLNNRMDGVLSSLSFKILFWPNLEDLVPTSLAKTWFVQDSENQMVCKTTISSTYHCDCNTTLFPCNHVLFILLRALSLERTNNALSVTGLHGHELLWLWKHSLKHFLRVKAWCRVCCSTLEKDSDVVSCHNCACQIHRKCGEFWRDFKLRIGTTPDCMLCGQTYRFG
ncbi:hypothetical protein P9112_000544 [Eukaryota sp. TZLM1-RC]